jgi:Sec-independent protein translocase protein TatA
MEILGIGMPELIFVIIIALIVLGPKDMQKAGRTVGKFMRDIVTSDGWKAFMQTSREIRTLPNRWMREANEELNKIGDEINAADPTRTRYGSLSKPLRPGADPPKSPRPAVPPVEVEKEDSVPPTSESELPKEDQEKNA